MKIENLEIYGLEESIITSGYPMLTKLPTEEEFNYLTTLISEKLKNNNTDKHIERFIKLGSCPIGTGHDSCLKSVQVQYDITMNHAMLIEWTRYHFHDISASTSKMHKLTKMNLDDVMGSRVRDDIKKALKQEIDLYNYMIDFPDKYSKEERREQFQVLIENTPLGMELTMRVVDNYLQIKSKYFQRRYHKMDFWRQYCQRVERLPLMKEILRLSDGDEW